MKHKIELPESVNARAQEARRHFQAHKTSYCTLGGFLAGVVTTRVFATRQVTQVVVFETHRISNTPSPTF